MDLVMLLCHSRIMEFSLTTLKRRRRSKGGQPDSSKKQFHSKYSPREFNEVSTLDKFNGFVDTLTSVMGLLTDSLTSVLGLLADSLISVMGLLAHSLTSVMGLLADSLTSVMGLLADSLTTVMGLLADSSRAGRCVSRTKTCTSHCRRLL